MIFLNRLLLAYGLIFFQSFIDCKISHYSKSAIAFLKEYGHFYHLFDQFLANEHNHYSVVGNNLSLNDSIAHRYRIRNYSNYHLWETQADQIVQWNTTKGENDAYNNRYRYGPQQEFDHFVSIFFRLDPWTEDGAAIHFVGIFPNLQNKKMVCRFLAPAEAVTQVVVESGFKDALARPIERDNIIHCPVPTAVKESLTDEMNSVSLDLVMEEEGGKESILLKNLRVSRTHELDRRKFTLSCSVITNALSDPLLMEWIIFNILVGVEHFFIFDSRQKIDINYWEEPIRPFLDANIVTLVPYHYSDFATLQRTIFQVM